MKQNEIRITTLVENETAAPNLRAEWGLAFWIEFGGRRILFDTGQGGALLHNARALGVDLAGAEAVALSHGHYDHAGGLPDFFRLNTDARFYAHPDAFMPKFSASRGGAHYVGMPLSEDAAFAERLRSVVFTETPTEIVPGLWLTGGIPRVTDFEDTGGPFFLDEDCRTLDALADDQALFFSTPRGTVVVLGCAHSGLVNTLEYIRGLTDNRHIHAVMGGTHLGGASPQRIEKTIEYLREIEVERIAACHCTGARAIARLAEVLPGRTFTCSAGERIAF